MNFDFTTVLDRRGQDSIAANIPDIKGVTPPKEGFDQIPMWIADMSFPVAPAIHQALQQRLDFQNYGYFTPDDNYFQSIIRWQQEKNQVQSLEPCHIGYENGVLGGLMAPMGVLCSQGEKVLVHSPTYVGFTNSLGTAGYQIVHSPLYLDENKVWRMDFADMEAKILANNIHTCVFCNPHNPSGRAWEPEELKQAMDLFEKHDITVISDEIWSDIILHGHKHTPMQSVSPYAREHTVALYSAAKTFSLAALVGGYHIIYNKTLREKVDRFGSLLHYNNMSVFTMHALMGAYSPEGSAWMEEMKAVISQNMTYAHDFFTQKIQGVTVALPQATYVMFIDCSQWLEAHGKDQDWLLKAGYDVGVVWQDGRLFQQDKAMRLNLSLPLSRLKEALDRLEQHVFT